MNLRNGKLTNSAQPIPKRRYNKKMVVTASAGGDQDPPQGSGTGAVNSAHVSTSTQGAQDIPGPTGSRPMDISQAIHENNASTIGTNPVSISATAPPSSSASGMQLASKNAANSL